MKICSHRGWNVVYNAALVVGLVLSLGCVIDSGTVGGDASTPGANGGDQSDGSYDRPEASKGVITDEEIDRVSETGMTIHEGTNPPDVTGVWKTDGATVTYVEEGDPYEVGREVVGNELTFSNMTEDGKIDVKVDSDASDGAMTRGDGTFISGSGD